MENALRAKTLDIREQYERQLADLQSAYGQAMLELHARKKLASLLGKRRTRNDSGSSAGIGSRWGVHQLSQTVPVVWRATAHGVLQPLQGCAAPAGAAGSTQ